MPVVSFDPDDIAWAKKVLASKVKLPEPKMKFKVGDVVQIIKKGCRHHEQIGEVVQASNGSYRVEPYNDPYYNDPACKSKTGPWFESELKKAKKPRGASLKYVPPKKTEDVLSAAELVQELSEKPEKPKKQTAKQKRNAELKKAFSGSGNSLVTKLGKGKGTTSLPTLTNKQKDKLAKLIEYRGNSDIKRPELITASQELYGIDNAFAWIQTYGHNKVGWGLYSLTVLEKAAQR